MISDIVSMYAQQLNLFYKNKALPISAEPERKSLEHLRKYFSPKRTILAKGSTDTPERQALVQRVCSFFTGAAVEERFDTPHNRVNVGDCSDAFGRTRTGSQRWYSV